MEFACTVSQIFMLQQFSMSMTGPSELASPDFFLAINLLRLGLRSLTEAVDANRQADYTEEKSQAKDGHSDQGAQQRLLFKPEVTRNTRRRASWNWETDVDQVLTTIASVPICAPTNRQSQLEFTHLE